MMIDLLIVHDNVRMKIFSFKTGKICHGFINEKSSPLCEEMYVVHFLIL